LAKQLTLDLGHRAAFGRDDFLVTPSNAAAVALVDQWPHWPSHAAVIVGAAGSGKTHLALVWQKQAQAKFAPAAGFGREDVPQILESGAVVIDNLQDGQLAETTVFHLLNHAQQTKSSILFTATHWPLPELVLPDLKSRLSALPVAVVLQPDDALLRGVLVKQFNDRQIAVDEALVSFLVTRMPRSLEVARQLVERIDIEAMEQRASVTRAFASKVLSHFDSPGLF
jgi:chromosomal replication initiation ATPase DnaA